jgi:hypothetical protein
MARIYTNRDVDQDWHDLWDQDAIPAAMILADIDRVAAEVYQLAQGHRVAFQWSGGKDSEVLRMVCFRAGVRELVMGICRMRRVVSDGGLAGVGHYYCAD